MNTTKGKLLLSRRLRIQDSRWETIVTNRKQKKKQKKDKNYKIEILKSSSIIHDTYFILVDIDREKYEGLILSTEEEV